MGGNNPSTFLGLIGGSRKENDSFSDVPRLPRSPRGAGGLTQFGKRMVRSACQILEEVANQRPIGFLTLTLPTMTREQLNFATENWSEITRQYMQELSREFNRTGLPNLWVFCTEWQKKRQALHAHIAFIAHPVLLKPRGDEYPIKKCWFRDLWQRILFNVLGENFDCTKATRVEKVKYSVGAYMSKYISKGDKPDKSETGFDLDTGELLPRNTQFPSAWWGACNDLKKTVKKRIEVWKTKVKAGVHSSKRPREDEWLEETQNIIGKMSIYWSRVVCSCGQIPRAIAGRLRLNPGWKLAAMKVFLGRKILPNYFKSSQSYWKWRYKRDGCDPLEDTVAENAWMEKIFSELAVA